MPVGKITSEKLRDRGFDYAHQLIGHYMVNNMDDEAMAFWLKNEIGIKRPDLRSMLIDTLQQWGERHL